jgi:hypothetical protein
LQPFPYVCTGRTSHLYSAFSEEAAQAKQAAAGLLRCALPLPPACSVFDGFGAASNDRHIRGYTTEGLGHSTFCGFSSAGGASCAVATRAPSIFRRRRSFGWAQPSQAPHGGAGEGAGGGTTSPQRFFGFESRAGEGLWGYQEGQTGSKLARFGQLGAARSRQDESIEVSTHYALPNFLELFGLAGLAEEALRPVAEGLTDL